MQKKLFLVLFQFLFITSCMMNGDNKSNVPVKDDKDEIVTGKEGYLSANEMQIGRAVCNALQNKIFKYQTFNLGKNYLFQITNTSCPPAVKTVDNAILRVTNSGNQLRYILDSNYSGSFFEEIITSRELGFNYFCPRIMSINPSDVTNFQDTAYNSRTKISFKGSINDPTVELYYFVNRNGREYSLDRKIALRINVGVDDLEGNTFVQTMFTSCLNSDQFSMLEQVYIP